MTEMLKVEKLKLFFLLNRLGGVVVEIGDAILFFQEIEPIGCGVLVKKGINSNVSPEPALIGGPKPKVSIWSGMGIEPPEISVIDPTLWISEKGSQPGRSTPTTSDFRNGFPPGGSRGGE